MILQKSAINFQYTLVAYFPLKPIDTSGYIWEVEQMHNNDTHVCTHTNFVSPLTLKDGLGMDF